MKLGKLPPKLHFKSIPFTQFRGTDPFPPVVKAYWEYKLPASNLRMFKNDVIGDCTVACIGHMIMNMTAHTGAMIVPTVEQILEFYSAISGYDPSQTDDQGNNPTDQGAAITDALNRWQTVGLAGHTILGWVKFDHRNVAQFDEVIYLFGGADCGVNLPKLAMDQFNQGQAWNVAGNDGGSDGGHCIPFLGYGRTGRTCITWAKEQPAYLAWIGNYLDEGYGAISQDWFDRVDVAPNHFKKDELWAYLKTLAA